MRVVSSTARRGELVAPFDVGLYRINAEVVDSAIRQLMCARCGRALSDGADVRMITAIGSVQEAATTRRLFVFLRGTSATRSYA